MVDILSKTRTTWMTLTLGLALLATAQPAEAAPVGDLADCVDTPINTGETEDCVVAWIVDSFTECDQGTGYAPTFLNGALGECYGACPEGTFVGTYDDDINNSCTGVGSCGSQGGVGVLVNGRRTNGSPACSDPPEPEPDPEPSDLLHCESGNVGVDGVHCVHPPGVQAEDCPYEGEPGRGIRMNNQELFCIFLLGNYDEDCQVVEVREWNGDDTEPMSPRPICV